MTETNTPCIMVVDDTSANLQLLGEILKEQYEARLIPNGKLALASAIADPPDLILLDVKMPGLDGYEVCQRLKAEKKTRDTPIIFISALQATTNKVKGFLSGGVDYITKPFQEEEVLARVNTHLRMRSLQAQLKQKNAELVDSNRRLEQEIRQRKRLEAERLKIKKLESMAIFAGGIAHDFNNLLFVILGHIEILKEDIEHISEAFLNLVEVEKAALKAANLTKKFTILSKGGQPEKRKASFAQLIDGVVRSFDLKDIEFEIDLPDDLWLSEYDQDQMKQVMENLITNAIEAMPHGGVIGVSAVNEIIEAGKGQPGFPPKSGKYVKLSVWDQGVGIPKEYLSRLYDPYFSTKDKYNQKGLGLGLSVVYAIINKHKGHISVQTEKHSGTTFTIYLPADAD